MANNFRLTGNVYVSKAGNDANDGLTPETPKLTIAAGLAAMTAGQTLIVGTGVYKETISGLTAINRTITADGLVKLFGNNSLSITLPNSTFIFNGIIFENYTTISILRGSFTFNNCRIVGILINSSGNASLTLTSSIIINCTISANNITISSSSRCIFINSFYTNGGGSRFMNNCYADPSSIISLYNISSTNNNIQSLIIPGYTTTVTSGIVIDAGGAYYDLSKAGTGGLGTQDNPFWRNNTNGKTFDFTNYRIAYSNAFGATNISTNPLFNDITRYDFTLQANSPHIAAGTSNTNIGGTNYAVSNYIVSDLEVVSGNTNTTNYIFSAFTTPKTVGIINTYGLLAFDKSQASGSTENKNVPDFDVFTSGDTFGRGSPDRLTYEMRWTASASQPVSDSDWDNGGLLPVGSYGVFQWFEQPYVDASGVSSGLYNYSSATRNSITAIWLDVKVTVRNNYTN